MSEEQLKLWQDLIKIFEQLAVVKFKKGTVEHSGFITDLTLDELEQAETEEIIDLVHYRMAKILKKLKENEQATNSIH